MRTLTLSESVIRIHLGFSRTNSPLKHFNSSSFVSSISQSHKPKHFNRNLSLLLSRYPSRCSVYANANEKSIDYFFSQRSSSDATDEDVRLQSCESCREAFHLAHEYDSCVTNKNVAGISSRNEELMSLSLEQEKTAASDTMPYSRLKFSVLLWFLTLQGSQQAIAAPGFANGLESIPYLGDLGDITTGFASAFLLIFFSELGDKTFFIAALLAARNSAAIIFVGTFGALAAMTIISVVLGRTFHYVDNLLPFSFGEIDLPLDDIAAVCLLVYFGVSTLTEAASSDGLKTEEEQKEAELAVSEFSGNGAGILAAASTVINTFLLVFVAEWGDKSFFSTVALAAASSPLGVIGGALAGHAVATMLAVLGGSLLGTFLSEKVIAYVGGSLFLVFAAVTLIEIFN